MGLNITAHLRQRLGTVSLGGHANVLAKETAEISVVFKAEFGRQLLDGQSGVNQFALCLLDQAVIDDLQARFAQDLPAQALSLIHI
jgi:hypothetical protein